MPDILIEPFLVTTSVSFFVIAIISYRKCPIMLPNRVTVVELDDIDMVDFDIILGMSLLHACFTSTECRTRIVKFNFPNELILNWKGGNSIPIG